jgi:hypothetical protein
MPDYRPRAIYLFRAGSVYLAVDTALRTADLGDAFLLDTSLSLLLARGHR